MIAYDVNRVRLADLLSWSLFASQAKGLLDFLGIAQDEYCCMGCSVALAFAARFPEATRALILHWPVGGYCWKMNGALSPSNYQFARINGLAA